MARDPIMFRIDPETHQSARIGEVEFAQLGFQERRDIQKWVAANPGILADDLLIVSEEFSGFDKVSERPDLLAVDPDGKLVIIELKRDDTGSDAHWQAIKYASYLSRATTDDIIDMLAAHMNVAKSEAAQRLVQHLGDDDLTKLNNDQRIILASHRFAPQVTSAVLWINGKTPDENLITCVQLTPYQDSRGSNDTALYVQATTIIPTPGVDDYMIGIGDGPETSSNFGTKYAQTVAQNRHDAVTEFLRQVSDLTLTGMDASWRPDQTSRWASQCTWEGAAARRYLWWYSRSPWNRRDAGASYRVTLQRNTDETGWAGFVEFWNGESALNDKISILSMHDDQVVEESRVVVNATSSALDGEFADELAHILREFIITITPIIDELEDENNQQQVPQ